MDPFKLGAWMVPMPRSYVQPSRPAQDLSKRIVGWRETTHQPT